MEVEDAINSVASSFEFATLVDSYLKFLRQYTDEQDMAWQSDGEYDYRQRRTNLSLSRDKQGTGNPDELTIDLVAQHLNGALTLHTHPRRGHVKVWVQVDIDAHQGQDDAPAVAALVLSLWPGCYQEPSTHGQGIHVYIWVNNFRDMGRFNSVLRKCQVLLDRLRQHKGLLSTIELKHTFTIFQDKVVSKRGATAKAPRLPNAKQSLDHLTAAPVFSLPQVMQTIKQALHSIGGRTRVKKTGWHKGETQAKAATTCTTQQLFNQPSCFPLDTPITDDDGRNHESHHSFADISPPAWDPSAFVRMLNACGHFRRTVGRLPTLDQLLSHYERVYPQAGAGDEMRMRRARDVLRYAERQCEPGQTARGRYVARPYTEMGGTISQEDRAVARGKLHHKGYTCRITDEDLGIAIYTLERASFTAKNPLQRYSFGTGSIMGMFHRLNTTGATTRGCNKDKELALKAILVKAGFMVRLDTGYLSGGGMTKKAGVGPTHPLYHVFQELMARFPVFKTIHKLEESSAQEQKYVQKFKAQMQEELEESRRRRTAGPEGNGPAPASAQAAAPVVQPPSPASTSRPVGQFPPRFRSERPARPTITRWPPRAPRRRGQSSLTRNTPTKRRRNDPSIKELGQMFRYHVRGPVDLTDENLLPLYRMAQDVKRKKKAREKGREVRRYARQELVDSDIIHYDEPTNMASKRQISLAEKQARLVLRNPGHVPVHELEWERFMRKDKERFAAIRRRHLGLTRTPPSR